MAAGFARVSITAGLVWGTLALYLSVVPSYVGDLLSTGNLALLGANSALACAASAVTQVVAQRRDGAGDRSGQVLGLALLTAGLVLLVVSAARQSLVPVLLAAVIIGVGHGVAFLHAQDELNSIAPADRRAEVTAAFVCVIYVLVGGAVVAVGLLGEAMTLTGAVGVVGVVLALAAAGAAAWQLLRVSSATAS